MFLKLIGKLFFGATSEQSTQSNDLKKETIGKTCDSTWEIGYTFPELLKYICSEDTCPEYIREKPQMKFIEDIFYNFSITFIIEYNYDDKDYLDDFSSYYVRCFRHYPRFCKRVHFFRKHYEANDIEQYFLNKQSDCEKKLQETYLGFIVIKPLPQTIIGRTCISYEHLIQQKNLVVPVIKEVKAHLFGIELTVSTLPFQEQDSVVSACATSALWSAFCMTEDFFHHRCFSPSKITQLAAKNLKSQSRTFPNEDGLKIEQMSQAIYEVGLEPLCIDFNTTDSSKQHDNIIIENTYAYVKCKIPVIMVVDVYDRGCEIGYHAVTIVGYKKNSIQATTWNPYGINELCVHDDRIAPFTRITHIYTTENNKWLSEKNEKPDEWLSEKNEKLKPIYLLIPVYHKIRITYEDIWEHVYLFNKVMTFMKKYEGIKWDIFLIASNDLKSEVRRDSDIKSDKHNILFSSLPKYLWKVDLLDKNNKTCISFLFDSTEVKQGLSVLQKIVYDDDFDQELSEFLRKSSELISIMENRMPDEIQEGDKKLYSRLFASAISKSYIEV